MSRPGERDGSWTLLTGHGHVLVEIARNPGARIRDISAAAEPGPATGPRDSPATAAPAHDRAGPGAPGPGRSG